MKELKSGIPYRDLEGKTYVSLDGDLYQIADGSGTKIEAQNAPKHLLTEDEYKQREEELENIQVGQVWETVHGRGTICDKVVEDGYLIAPYGWLRRRTFVRFTGEIQEMLNAKVGEKWRTRGGQIATILEDDKSALPYLVRHNDNLWHFANGQVGQLGDEYRHLDLVELVEDVKPEIPGEEVDVKTLRAGDIVAAESDGAWHEYMLLDNWCEGLRCFYVRPLGTKELDTIQVNGLRLVSRSTQPQLKVGQKWKRYDGAIVTIKALDPEIIDHAVGRKNSGRRPFVMDELTYATPAYAPSESNPFNLVELVEDAPQQVEAPAVNEPQGEIVPFESLRAGDVVYVKRDGEWVETELYANPSEKLGCARPFLVYSQDAIILKQRYNGPSLKVGQKWERRDGKTVEIVEDDGSGLPMVDSAGGWFFRNNPLKNVTSPSHPYDLIRMVQDEHGNPVTMTIPQVGEVWEREDGEKFTVRQFMVEGYVEARMNSLEYNALFTLSYPALPSEKHVPDWHLVRRVEETLADEVKEETAQSEVSQEQEAPQRSLKPPFDFSKVKAGQVCIRRDGTKGKVVEIKSGDGLVKWDDMNCPLWHHPDGHAPACDSDREIVEILPAEQEGLAEQEKAPVETEAKEVELTMGYPQQGEVWETECGKTVEIDRSETKNTLAGIVGISKGVISPQSIKDHPYCEGWSRIKLTRRVKEAPAEEVAAEAPPTQQEVAAEALPTQQEEATAVTPLAEEPKQAKVFFTNQFCRIATFANQNDAVEFMDTKAAATTEDFFVCIAVDSEYHIYRVTDRRPVFG